MKTAFVSKLVPLFVSQIEIMKHDWISAYVANVTRLIEERGGKVLARTSEIEKMEGEQDGLDRGGPANGGSTSQNPPPHGCRNEPCSARSCDAGVHPASAF
jgi:Domain of unknown function (DUF1330)